MNNNDQILEQLINVPHDSGSMEGLLKIPPYASALVLFAHGSGSSRFSPRNNFVANILNEVGLASLLIDLLSKKEDEIYQTRFDINLLAERLNKVVQWLTTQKLTKSLVIGLFGASTGAAAALHVAAKWPDSIKAVVSRGGRPDLAMNILEKVIAPTLLIVGGNDGMVIELNQAAYEKLNCPKKMNIIPHATHLFEEAGCLEEVAKQAKLWFNQYLQTN